MAKAQKLKVFRTPIGFHDAYVAAPSQKAALEAWGSDANLFASGAAEAVTEAELMKVPLDRPGEVIKVLRGTKAEQVAALGEVAGKPAKQKKGGSRIKSGMTKKRERPSRASLDAAEEAVEALARAQASEFTGINEEIASIERKRREIERRQRRELGEMEDRAKRERVRYERELERWRENN